MMDETVQLPATNSTQKKDQNTKLFSCPINGVPTDFVINKFTDRYFIVITQTGSIGTLVSAEKDSAQVDKDSTIVYTIRVLLGKDDEDVHIGARFLAGQLDLDKPILFSFCIKDFGPSVLKTISQTLKERMK